MDKKTAVEKWAFFIPKKHVKQYKEDFDSVFQIGETAERECSIIVYKDGTYKLVESLNSWEYEQDKDWLTTIKIDDPNLF